MTKFTKKEIWLHNSFLGRAAMAQQGMLGIINSKTATVEAKELACDVMAAADKLSKALKKRVDQ